MIQEQNDTRIIVYIYIYIYIYTKISVCQIFSSASCLCSVRVRFTDLLLRPTFLNGQKQNKKHSRVTNAKSHTPLPRR